jgi:leucyl-tRNA synthetase
MPDPTPILSVLMDFLRLWSEQKVFDVDAPSLEEYPASISNDELHAKAPKFFGTMACM